jgi:NAD(P)H-dependent flavin oxidoreductase YrpB (nitropropane dioxygenase family)
MAFVGLPELVVAVSNAGGLGVYGAAPEPPPVVDARLAAIASQTTNPFGVDFIIASGPLGDFTTQAHIDVAAAHRVPVVVFHFDLPQKSWVDQLQAAGSRVWIQAGSVEVAEYAHPDYKARLVSAKGRHATTFTTVFGPEFPDATQRVLANRAATEPLSTEPPVIGSTLLFPGIVNAPYQMPKYSAIVPTRDTTGDLEEMDMPAGSESVLEIVRVQPAAEVIEEIVSEARELIEKGDTDAVEQI